MLVNPTTSTVQRIIGQQYNPDTISRTLRVKRIGERGDRSQALRLKGPPRRMIKLKMEINGTKNSSRPGGKL